MTLPLFYSFRRCPYAMRARMALVLAGINVEIREISLKAKPEAFLQTSPKGTVPVMVTPEGQVIEESLEVIGYAHQRCDNTHVFEPQDTRIYCADTEFAAALRRYKYFERYPEQSQRDYLACCMPYVEIIESDLSKDHFLLGGNPSFNDIAIFPLLRQFAKVDEQWFESSELNAIKRWLTYWYQSEAYLVAMTKYSVWHTEDKPVHLLRVT